MERTILHVDMDAFFASVEQREHPEWRGKPVIVGAAPHERGVVSTCSYEARKFGVHSAMPSRTAYERCPAGIFVRPDISLYKEVSRAVFEVFGRFSPYVEAVSIDEAFLDITGSLALFGGVEATGRKLREAVREETSLPCSVGIGPSRLLAKIASELAKPDGLFITPFDPEEVRLFLAPRKAGILWGVGGKTAAIMERYALRTCGDIQNTPLEQLSMLLGDSAAASIRAHAFGIDTSPVRWQEEEEKSVSREYTFPEDCSCREEVRARLMQLVEEVGRRFRTKKRWACTGRLKLRSAAFDTLTRQAPFPEPVRDDIAFRAMMLNLFDKEWPPGAERSVRLAGWGVTNFTSSPQDSQPSLFDSPENDSAGKRIKRERLCDALDAIWEKRRSKKRPLDGKPGLC